jgi:hypothetical protein
LLIIAGPFAYGQYPGNALKSRCHHLASSLLTENAHERVHVHLSFGQLLLELAFSLPSSRSRLASVASMPPNIAHLSVASLTPLRHDPLTGMPASACLRTDSPFHGVVT